jgi:membrane-associated phospholipid phosphatase
LGRHWPLDVLTAYVVGLGLLSGLIWLHSAFRYVKARRPDPAADRQPTTLRE